MNNKRNGQGTYLFINGDKYEGEWKDDLKNGYGVYTYQNGSKKKGVFINGILQGPGEIEHPDHIVKGSFKDGEIQAPSKIFFKASQHVVETSDLRYLGATPAAPQIV